MLRTDMQIRLWEEAAATADRGESLAVGLREMAETAAHTPCGRMARSLADAMEQGRTLSEAVAAHKGMFHPGTIAAIRAGERSGRLPQALAQFAQSISLEQSLCLGVLDGVLYPMIISVAALMAMAFLRFVIVPGFADMFEEMDIDLPVLTMILPEALAVMAFVLLTFSAALIVLFVGGGMRSMPLARFLDRGRLAVPLLGTAVRQALFARWCVTLGGLLGAGASESEAMRMAGDSTGSPMLGRISDEMAGYLEQGHSLEQELGEYGFFPPLVSWTVAAARKTGNHLHVWPTLAEMFAEQAEELGRWGGCVLSLVLSVLMAFCIGFTVIGVFLPLVRLMQCLGG